MVYGARFPTQHEKEPDAAMIRDALKAAQIAAMKAGEKDRLAAIRLILAKLKDRDIELRTAGTVPDDDVLVVEVLQKMLKQRRESIAMYEQGNRPELAAKEAAEVVVIESFLPGQLSEDETRAAIEAIKAEVGAASVKDMGKVMAVLKERHGSVIDMGKASGLVKAALG
ncbi:GatB/YqeY domain-containing protein [soil metagenome]